MNDRPTRLSSLAGHPFRIKTSQELRQTPLSLLLVGTHAAWTEAIRQVAAQIGVTTLDTAGNTSDALTRLAMARRPYSHVLLDHAEAGDMFTDLLKLTIGDAGSGTELVLLDTEAGKIPGTIAIAHPTSQSIGEALSIRSLPVPSTVPMLSGTELAAVIAGPSIETRYQPIVSLDSRDAKAVEVLARLNHPTRGTLAAEQFVPQIEAAGLAMRLTEAVGVLALSEMSAPAQAGHKLRIGINFPLDVMLHTDALDCLDAQRRACGLGAERVTIELTESRPADDMPALRRAIDRIHNAGYDIALDDVVPTTPHLTALLELPVAMLKIDKSVVQQAGTDRQAHAFIDRLITLAKARDALIVAEGVEDLETWHLMRAMGVDRAQGYLIARPLPASALPIWLDAWRVVSEFC
jgi:EAL domain-containing protein (putative c-di-GMP-specific phosphodiesterase class I)